MPVLLHVALTVALEVAGFFGPPILLLATVEPNSGQRWPFVGALALAAFGGFALVRLLVTRRVPARCVNPDCGALAMYRLPPRHRRPMTYRCRRCHRTYHARIREGGPLK